MLQHELMDLKTRLLNEHSSLLSGSASKLSLPAVSLRSEFAESELSQSSSGNVIQAPPKPTLPFSDLILDGQLLSCEFKKLCVTENEVLYSFRKFKCEKQLLIVSSLLQLLNQASISVEGRSRNKNFDLRPIFISESKCARNRELEFFSDKPFFLANV